MKNPLIFLGADHAGFELKEKLKGALEQKGYTFTDLSPIFTDGDDYPAHARRVAMTVKKDTRARGILVCGSGVGMTIAANRIKGVRAFDAHTAEEVTLARQDNNVNVITLSGWHLDEKTALDFIELFLKTPFSKAVRHHRRVEALDR